MNPNAKRSLGQNFLVDEAYIARIVDGAGVRPTDTVLEIGPGRGALTDRLRARAARFIAIEKDDALAAYHDKAFADDPTSALVHGDALKVQPADLPFPGPYRIVANLPYNLVPGRGGGADRGRAGHEGLRGPERAGSGVL